jgi:serine/threonine protein kinase
MQRSYSEVKEIFLNAIENYAPDEWSDYLDVACGNDVVLRQLVNDILASHLDEDSILDRGEPGQRLSFSAEQFVPRQMRDEQVGGRIGPYELVEILGQGGMGVVFKAKQTEPYERLVAIKLIRPEFDTEQMLTRFQEERQVLAMMSHPNIATVLDGGSTDQGRPYFVMELVDGVPIDEFCDRENLTTVERVKLLSEVCDAVQHAHHKAVVHSDLKPGNILVSLVDGKPFPQIIDFGVARPVFSSTMHRDSNAVMPEIVGTPEYMSPEQISNKQDAIDNRADIYSLGALLYKLVVGVPPVDPQRLRDQDWITIQQMICEEVPPSPSQRSEMIAGELVALNPRLAWFGKYFGKAYHELDSIVLKAMHKEPDERYSSAHDLANDLRRFVEREPVAACSDDRRYRLQKFVGRQKNLLAAVGLIVGFLATGLPFVLQQYRTMHQHASLAIYAQQRAMHAEQKHRDLLIKLLTQESTSSYVPSSLMEEDSVLDLILARDSVFEWASEGRDEWLWEFHDGLTTPKARDSYSDFRRHLNLVRLKVHLLPSTDIEADLTRLSELQIRVEKLSRRDALTLDWLRCQFDDQAGRFESALEEMTRIRRQATEEFPAGDDRILEFVGLELRRSLTLGLVDEANERIQWLLNRLESGEFSPSKVEWILSHFGTRVLIAKNRSVEAMDLVQDILAIHARLGLGETAQTLALRRQQMTCACELSQRSEAERVALQNLEVAISSFGFSHRNTELVRLDLAQLLADQQKWTSAERLIEDVLSRLRSNQFAHRPLIQISEQQLQSIRSDSVIADAARS